MRLAKWLKKLHDDERGEVTTQQLLYLAIGAIVAAILYKYGGQLLQQVRRTLGIVSGDDAATNMENGTTTP